MDFKRANWIPRRMASIIVETKKHSRNRKVKDLFLEGTRIWNEERVKELFPTHDAEDILKLEVLRSGPDVPACHFENSGLFTVKSAYKLAYDLANNTQFNSGSSNTGDDTRKMWSSFGNAKFQIESGPLLGIKHYRNARLCKSGLRWWRLIVLMLLRLLKQTPWTYQEGALFTGFT